MCSDVRREEKLNQKLNRNETAETNSGNSLKKSPRSRADLPRFFYEGTMPLCESPSLGWL